MVKYPTKSITETNDFKKIGYFATEAEIIDEVWQYFNLQPGRRFLLSYVMEAADDIAYSTSDIQDGIEKGIVTSREFIRELKDIWALERKAKSPFPISDPDDRDVPFAIEYAIKWSHHLVARVVDVLYDRIDSVLEGKAESLFKLAPECDEFRKSINTVCRKLLYRSPEAENIELAGFRVIEGILEGYRPLMEMRNHDFELLLQARREPDVLKGKGLDLEWRLFNKIGRRYVTSYENELSSWQNYEYEWLLRAHMIVDHISGMTDRFALDTYHLLQGIRTWTRQ
jgi:dGTPase